MLDKLLLAVGVTINSALFTVFDPPKVLIAQFYGAILSLFFCEILLENGESEWKIGLAYFLLGLTLGIHGLIAMELLFTTTPNDRKEIR